MDRKLVKSMGEEMVLKILHRYVPPVIEWKCKMLLDDLIDLIR